MPEPGEATFALLASLRGAASSAPLAPKILVAPTFGEGSELLRSLALCDEGWAGFEVTTPFRLASRIAGSRLARRGLATIDPFAQRALVDRAIDGVLVGGEWPELGVLEHGVGFREAVLSAISALRLTGVGPRALTSGPRRRAFLGAVLWSYEAALASERLADPAEAMREATKALGEGASVGFDRPAVFLVPGLSARGIGGAFVRALKDRGAVVLATDPVVGAPPPSSIVWEAVEPAESRLSFLLAPPEEGSTAAAVEVDMFRAASVRDELREVLRRAMAGGLAWDDVEIVTPDPNTYGSALHALTEQLEVPCSFGVGLPIRRTRPGRALEGYLRWIESGFPAEVLRGLLEAGDVAPPPGFADVAPEALARRLRRLRIGWGRARYLPAVRQALRLAESELARAREGRPGRGAAEEERLRREASVRELRALASLLGLLDEASPRPPRPFAPERGNVSAAEIARGVEAFFQLVPPGRGSDAVARRDLLERLERIAETLTRKTTFEAAAAALRRHLDIRVRAAWDEGSPPWKSTGGHVHLTDLAHGGFTGRKATFLVGFDADRFPGAGIQHPVLGDGDRKALASELPTAPELLGERRFQLAALLARVRGRVTASYTAWSSAEARVAQPASILLALFRLWRSEPGATFEDLRRGLGEPVCALPRSGPLDGTDVWLDALSTPDGGFREAPEPLAESFPELGRGVAAQRARTAPRASPHHGLVAPRPALMDPRADPSIVVSATRLETLGTCPLRYLMRYGLGWRPPDDPSLDAGRWLDPLQRGRLLHRVFERTLALAREARVPPQGPGLLDVAVDALEAEIGRLRTKVPIPNRAAYETDVARLAEDVRSFVNFVGERGAPWIRLEMEFGRGDAEAVRIGLRGGSILVQGAVDRIDRGLGGLHVLDYKTGTPYRFKSDATVFDGGRRMQHVIYAEAVEQLLDERVGRVSYVFPTRRGQNEERTFERGQLRPGLKILGVMLDQLASGRLLPTDDAGDCRFCDFASVCRVRSGPWGVGSPLAEWGKKHLGSLDEYGGLSRIRGWEGGQ